MSATTSTNIVVTPEKNDVKSGAGVHSHHGNKFYHKLIKEKKKDFVLSLKNTKAKDAIAREVYNTINKLKPPGRFLQKNRDGTFTIKSKQYALVKIKKALGENSAQIEAYFRNRGLLKDTPSTSAGRKRMPSESGNRPNTFEPLPARRKRPQVPQVTPEPLPPNSKSGITSGDWKTLFKKIGDINEDDIKTIKRQRLRGLLLASVKKQKEKEAREKLERKPSKLDMLTVVLASMSLSREKKKANESS